MSDWRRIETAPKDGTRILVFSPDADPNIYVDLWIKKSWWNSYGDEQPSHWIPLPEPPLMQGSGA